METSRESQDLFHVKRQITCSEGNVKLAAAAAAKLLPSCLTLCDPIDGNPPGSSVPGILQARMLEWVAILLLLLLLSRFSRV